ncbi:MAG TPA: SGNH/GDSL hydrolase family protein [Candidatus Sulfotelmatobacter sp.]|nr:SGNH/GDSL hydrolase family protein [Candidatus Sulfotelmatobacter sp.]
MTTYDIFSRRLRRAALPLALLGALAGCAKIKPSVAPIAVWGSANFNTIVAMGTSISAGFESGGLVQRHQTQSFPYLFARQVGSPQFTIPNVNLDGWPPLLRIQSLGPPLVIDTTNARRGAWINIAQPTPYHDLAVPGALLADVQDVSLNYNPGLGRDASFFNNILREGQQTIPRSLLQLVTARRPTFITFEFGSNELLGPAAGGSGTPLVPAPVWAGLLHQTLDSLDFYNPAAKKVIFTVPDVLTIPFFTTLPIVELDRNQQPQIGPGGPKFLIGPSGSLAPGDFVTLEAGSLLAAGYGYAVGDTSYLSGGPVPGNGLALPDQVVLSAAEAASITSAVDAYNAAISSEAAARGYGVLDFHGLLQDINANGYTFAGTHYTTQFITGGLVSLDGVHPTDLAHGIIANALIDVVNAKWGAQIPTLDLSQSLTATSSEVAHRGAGESSLAPVTGALLAREAFVRSAPR